MLDIVYQSFNHVQLFVTPWTVQVPLSMGFSRQEYWNGLPFPSPWHLYNPRIEPTSLVMAGEFFTTEPPGSWTRNSSKQSFVSFYSWGAQFSPWPILTSLSAGSTVAPFSPLKLPKVFQPQILCSRHTHDLEIFPKKFT